MRTQYTYDGAGNLLTKTINGTQTSYSYNAANELSSSGYSYDANGNLTGMPNGETLAYNAANQTSSITPPGQGAIGMTYSGPGQADRTTAGSERTGYDALGLADDATNGDGPTYICDNQGQLVAQDNGSSEYYYLFDGLGNVVALTNTADNVVATYQYDPYGNVTAHTGSVANPYQFGRAYGAYTDPSPGLVKIGTRYYDPTTTRWTQQDSGAGALTNPATLDRYVYAACRPTNNIDPMGASFASCFSSALEAELIGVTTGGLGTYLGVISGLVTPIALLGTGGTVVLGAAIGGLTGALGGCLGGLF